MNKSFIKKVVIIGIVAVSAMGTLTGCATTTAKQTHETELPQVNEVPSQTSPMGERKMLDIDGNRYVFYNNGGEMVFVEEQLGEAVGEQAGGVLYTLAGYDTDFRMAFLYDGVYYMVENVGHSNDTAIDINAYLENAALANNILFADIFDHMGGNILRGLDQENAIRIVEAFEAATVVDLEESQHEAIAKAQSEGLSYQLVFTLEDYTTFTSYVIPSLGYVTIGDYTCELEGFESILGADFEGLEVRENIIMN